MRDILDEFIDNAKQTIKEGYYDAVTTKANFTQISLRQKLTTLPFTLIAEIKHASPAGEYQYKNIDAEKTALIFRESGADAISVVAEPKLFKGRVENIAQAKKAGLPVLFKDFIFTEEQIMAARLSGADAILLVVKVAERTHSDLDFLIDCAHRKGLEVLLESYDEKEFERALDSDADILGINNRNLMTLKVDITRTAMVMTALKNRIDRPVISESGIKTAQDVTFVRRSGVNGILVGTAIWKASNLQEKIAELKRG
jgi:indole-3-glycerol phosphate synthase